MYHIKTTEIKNKPGAWAYTLCEVFKYDVKIGEYRYNYSSGAETIFFPFEQDGQWYATYTDNYSQLKIMTLPDCKFFCKFEFNGHGLCPVECYVPEYLVSREIKENKTVINELGLAEISEWLEKEEFGKFSFNSEQEVENFSKLYINSMNNVYKMVNTDTIIEFDKTVKYRDKLIVTGCFWACPFDIYWADISDLKSKKGKTLEYEYLCEERMYPFDEMIEVKLKNRVNVTSDGITALTTTDREYIEKQKAAIDLTPIPKTFKEKLIETVKIWRS